MPFSYLTSSMHRLFALGQDTIIIVRIARHFFADPRRKFEGFIDITQFDFRQTKPFVPSSEDIYLPDVTSVRHEMAHLRETALPAEGKQGLGISEWDLIFVFIPHQPALIGPPFDREEALRTPTTHPHRRAIGMQITLVDREHFCSFGDEVHGAH